MTFLEEEIPSELLTLTGLSTSELNIALEELVEAGFIDLNREPECTKISLRSLED